MWSRYMSIKASYLTFLKKNPSQHKKEIFLPIKLQVSRKIYPFMTIILLLNFTNSMSTTHINQVTRAWL
jgi:hypothetical protein